MADNGSDNTTRSTDAASSRCSAADTRRSSSRPATAAAVAGQGGGGAFLLGALPAAAAALASSEEHEQASVSSGASPAAVAARKSNSSKRKAPSSGTPNGNPNGISSPPRKKKAANPASSSAAKSTSSSCSAAAAAASPTKANKAKTTSAEDRWDDMLARLVRFKEEHGDCQVPNRYETDPKLGAWVSTQRRHYRIAQAKGDVESNSLTSDRIQRLEDIGFEWTGVNPRYLQWDVRYQEMIKFKAKFGNTNIPIGWSKNVKLANWTSTQRQEYKNKMKGKRSRLDDRRIQMLNDIGFSWELQRGGKKRRLVTSAERGDDGDDDDASSAASSSSDEDENPATSGSGRSGDDHTEAGSSATISGVAAPSLPSAPTQNLTLSEQLCTQRMLNQIQEGLLQDARENHIRELIASSTNHAHAQPQPQLGSSVLHTLLAQSRLQQSFLNGNLSSIGDNQLQALIAMISSSQGASASSYTQSSLSGNPALSQSLLSGPGNTGTTTGHSSVGSLINNTNGTLNSNNNHALRQALLGLTSSSSSIGQPQSSTAGISAEALLQHALNTVQQQQQHSVSASSTNAFAALLALQSNQASSSSQSNEEGKHQPE